MKKYIPFLLIIALTILVWHKILGQTFLGEGYYYFDTQQDFIEPDKEFYQPAKFDNLARILFDILPAFFGDQIVYYLLFQLFIMCVFNCLLFATFRLITKNVRISFLATVLFLTSFVGGYEMWAIGNYQRFVQRIPNLIPVITSFIFLHSFLVEEKKRYYLLSVISYTLSVYLAHFTTFLLPLMLLYPLLYALLVKKNFSNIIKSILTILPFALISSLLVQADPHTPRVDILELITHRTDLVPHILLQLSNASLPIIVIETFSWFTKDLYPFVKTRIVLSFVLLPIFISGFYFIKKESRQNAVLYATAFLTAIALFTINLIFDKVDPFNHFGNDRYFLLPVLFISLVWAMIIRKSTKFLLVIFVCIYCLYNISLIWSSIYENQYKTTAMKRYLSYIKSLGPFNKNTTIVSPTSLLWPAAMIETLYGETGMIFIDFGDGWEDKVRNYPNNVVYVLDYDYEIVPGGLYDPNAGKLLDHTKAFREGKAVNYIK